MMGRVKKTVIAVAGVLVLAGGAASAVPRSGAAAEADASSPEASGHESPSALDLTALHLKTSTVDQSTTDVIIPAGRAQVGTTLTLTCPGETTCVLEADQYAQIEGSADSNRWSICTHVDGQILTEPSCPYLGLVPNGFYGTGSFVQTKSALTPGDHHVKTFVYAKKGANVTTYVLIYRMYTT